MLVEADLRDHATGVRFLAVNTHFDNFSRRSRVTAAQFVRLLVAERGLPAVVMGDLNSGERTAPLLELFADGTLTDAWPTAAERLTPEWGSFPNYRPPKLERKRIDWIAVTPDVRVERIGLNARRPRGAWPSDHLPVQAVLRLPDAS